MAQSESKIDKTTIFLMVGTALLFDIASIIPVVNWFSLFFAYLTFAVWFMIKRISLFGLKKIATSVSAAIIEAIPALSAIPSITLMVLVIISMEKAEEKGLDVKGLAKNPNIISKSRKAARPKKPNVITPSRKSVLENEKINTRDLRRAV